MKTLVKTRYTIVKLWNLKMLNNGVLFTFLYYNKIVKMFDSGDGMNKIYILCEYGISLNIVQKLKKFSINEILYKPYETI